MKKGIKYVLGILGISGAVGGAGYLGYKKGRQDGLKYGSEQVNKILELYQEEEKEWKKAREKEIVIREEVVQPTEEDLKKLEELYEEPDKVDIPEVFVNEPAVVTIRTSNDAPENEPAKEKRRERKRLQPYFIESGDFDSGMINYDKVDLVVYAEDGTITLDDMHTLYDHPEYLKGVMSKLCKFPDEYFVRNDSALTDYDITVINGSYAEEV